MDGFLSLEMCLVLIFLYDNLFLLWEKLLLFWVGFLRLGIDVGVIKISLKFEILVMRSLYRVYVFFLI